MTDIAEAGLPVKSPGNLNNKVEVQVVDGTTPTQKQTVDTDGNANVEVHGDNPAGGDETLRLSELGAVNPDGDYDANNNTKPANIGLIAADRAASPADSDQNQRLTAKTGTVDTDVHALDVSMHDANGNAFSSSNPVPVAGTVTSAPANVIVSGPVTVGTTEVEAKVGATTLANRLFVSITNDSAKDIFYGPTGVTVVTGDILKKGGQYVSLPLSTAAKVFLISADVGLDIRVQEFS